MSLLARQCSRGKAPGAADRDTAAQWRRRWLSAGVIDDDSLRWALSTGAARIIISSAALADLGWCTEVCARHGGRVAVGLDVRDGRIAPRGRPAQESGPDLFDVLGQLDRAGGSRYIVTDVRRDGTLAGPNLALLRQVCENTDRPVVASGGVSTLDDLRRLTALQPAPSMGSSWAKPRTTTRSPWPRRWWCWTDTCPSPVRVHGRQR